MTSASPTSELIALVLPLLTLGVAIVALWVASKQMRSGSIQTELNTQALKLNTLQADYSIRLASLTAEIESLKFESRLNAQHAERCEEQLAALKARLGE